MPKSAPKSADPKDCLWGAWESWSSCEHMDEHLGVGKFWSWTGRPMRRHSGVPYVNLPNATDLGRSLERSQVNTNGVFRFAFAIEAFDALHFPFASLFIFRARYPGIPLSLCFSSLCTVLRWSTWVDPLRKDFGGCQRWWKSMHRLAAGPGCPGRCGVAEIRNPSLFVFLPWLCPGTGSWNETEPCQPSHAIDCELSEWAEYCRLVYQELVWNLYWMQTTRLHFAWKSIAALKLAVVTVLVRADFPNFFVHSWSQSPVVIAFGIWVFLIRSLDWSWQVDYLQQELWRGLAGKHLVARNHGHISEKAHRVSEARGVLDAWFDWFVVTWFIFRGTYAARHARGQVWWQTLRSCLAPNVLSGHSLEDRFVASLSAHGRRCTGQCSKWIKDNEIFK